MAYRVWDFFGDVPNYVEPFFGSGAVLLGRPSLARTETINDKDCFLANFWRAVQQDPEAVAHFCDGPVNEADLHARHRWLVAQKEFRERMMSDPFYYDARIAGWWCWGISQWIGSGWCSRPEWMGRNSARAARGIHTEKYRQRPSLTRVRSVSLSPGVLRQEFVLPFKRPVAKRQLSGVLRKDFSQPLTGSRARSPHHPSRQLPQLHGDSGAVGRGVLSKTIRQNLLEYMFALADRLRAVRVCCGDWKRILGPSPTTCIGVTGVFLDPPYSAAAGRYASLYNAEDLSVAKEVAAWCVAHGNDPKLRIALCGYAGEHTMPKSWTCLPWKANGGYGNQADSTGRSNAGRERIWFSPHCLKPGTLAGLATMGKGAR